MGIRLKLMAGFMGACLLLIIVSAMAVYGLNSMKDGYRQVTTESDPAIIALREIQFYFTGQANDERGFLLTQGKEFRQEIQGKAAEVTKRIAVLLPLVKAEEERDLLAKIADAHARFTQINLAVIDQYTSDADAAKKLSFEVGRSIRKELQGNFDQLAKINEERAKKNILDAEALAGRTMWLIIGTAVVAVIFSIFAGAVLANRISRPIYSLVGVVQKVSGGDLRHEIKVESRDEIGQLAAAFNTMVAQLRELVRQIAANAEQLAASSQELSASSEQSAQAASQIATSISDVAAGAASQLSAANEASAVTAQISAGIQQIAANTNQVAAQSASAVSKARDGGDTVDKAVVQMNQIEATVNTSAGVVAKLGERSKEIGQIVETIAGIAGQTNLLALNAAIEAARAGEAGRGFAVVAEEVRKLAEQSQEAAKQIAALIGEIQGETDKAVDAMSIGTREVKTGAEVVSATGAAFQEIVDLISEVSERVRDISAASQQMASGSQQIVSSVKKIDELTKKSVAETQSVSAATEEQLATMEEIAGSSQVLAKLAQGLQTSVAAFQM